MEMFAGFRAGAAALTDFRMLISYWIGEGSFEATIGAGTRAGASHRERFQFAPAARRRLMTPLPRRSR